ncbi:uncharacterized protein HMPREF1541_08615 [Cyphellophora europaea CBS 101466]|uniref:Uncharacterized protein n=1 Tax=Cyphellophora europaea (strain CBS 101466) TaxID=1220924 RepID=W2RKV1_CYPE1|nr:uncharacterized protein HMPREF1541_08615 [Cyphellophora europaea CBS 101466]ETN36338.1 hypothetical protein HMPREF1541_08615 [Cyphellophora europaea CBS 101466]
MPAQDAASHEPATVTNPSQVLSHSDEPQRSQEAQKNKAISSISNILKWLCFGERRKEQDGRSMTFANLDYILPQSLDDSSIQAAVFDFFRRIDAHVNSRFYPDHVRLDEEDAVNAAPQSAHHATQPGLDVGALLRYERARFQTIKSLICGEVLEAIDFYGDQSKSLLPKVVTAFLSKVAKRREDDHPNRLSTSRWRTSTGYLLGDRQSPEDQAARDEAIQKIIQTLNPILQPFADPKHEDTRQADLVFICRKAEQLGMILLAQPAEWMFDWTSDPEPVSKEPGRCPVTSRPFVVFPALVKVTDKSARVIEPPQIVLSQKKVSFGSWKLDAQVLWEKPPHGGSKEDVTP